MFKNSLHVFRRGSKWSLRRATHLLFFSWSLLATSTLQAQTATPFTADDWNGTWNAMGTLFSVAVTARNGVFQVDEVQSLGFVWSATPGMVDGDRARLDVQYAGASAVLVARLVDDGVAVVEAARCVPEFMVVCLLAKGQQATFVRQ